MKRRFTGPTSALVATLAAVMLAGGTSAQIYRYVDEDGVVHFTDQKPDDGQNADTVRLPVAPTAPPAPAPAPAEADAEPEGAPPSAEEIAEQAAEQAQVRERNCAIAKQNIELLDGRFRLRDSETGEFLDGAARDTRREEMRARIEELC